MTLHPTLLPLALAALAGLCAPLAGAQTAAPAAAVAPAPSVAPAPAAEAAPLPANPARERVGDATRNLLSLQRSAGGANRPISGDQAGLSYQRYLDSFKHPIPETLDSMVRGAAKSP